LLDVANETSLDVNSEKCENLLADIEAELIRTKEQEQASIAALDDHASSLQMAYDAVMEDDNLQNLDENLQRFEKTTEEINKSIQQLTDELNQDNSAMSMQPE